MSIPSIGDLSLSYSMRQRNVALRQQIEKLTAELASGQVADVRDVLAGNYSYLADIERRTSVLEGFGVATAEATLFTGSLQEALGVIEEYNLSLSSSLLTAGTSAIGATSTDTVAEARNGLEALMGALSANTAGRYIFSGTLTDRPPLPEPDVLLDALRTAVGTPATPDDLLTAAETWFDDPAGFQAVIYQGSDDALSPFTLSETDRVALDVRAIDPAIRDALRLTAVAALADDPAFGFSIQEQSELFDKAGQNLLVTQDDLVQLRADVGFVEARIDRITARNAAELTSLEYAKLDLLEVDPFEAATRLEEVQFQLQSLYSVTVRNSQLSLVNFL